jgi:ribosomal protein L29
MTLPKYKNLKEFLTIDEIDQEIFILQKKLFNLRIKKTTNQNFKSHFFKYIKREITQLNFKKNLLLILNN